MALGHLERIRSEVGQQYPNMSADLLEKLARAIFVKRENPDLTPDLNSFLEKNPKLRSVIGHAGELEGYEASVIMPVEFVERSPTKKGVESVESLVKGTALYPTLSRNFNRYLKEELDKAYHTLEGVPIQVDHSRSVADTFGVVDAINYSKESVLTYDARLKANHPVTESIELGYVKSSSVGLRAKMVECSICGKTMSWFHEHIPGFKYEIEDEKGVRKTVVAEAIPRDFYFNHLAMTSFPGVEGATVGSESIAPPNDEVNGFVRIISEMYSPLFEDVYESVTNITEGSKLMNDTELSALKSESEKNKALVDEYRQQLASMKTEQEALRKSIEEREEQDRQAMISEIVDMEVQLGRCEEKQAKVRKLDLSELKKEALQARFEVMTEYIADKQPDPKRPKSIASGSGGAGRVVEQQENSGRFIREAEIERLGQIIYGESYNPSWSAVRTLDRWNHWRGVWKNPLEGLIH